MEKVKLTENDDIFIRDRGRDGVGCGWVNNDGHLYFINRKKGEAYRLPDKYKDTPIVLYHPCGGFHEGLIMVSLLGEIRLQYHHSFFDTAGMWGWIDPEGNEVIPPQYVFAMSFFDGRAVVCKGDWSVDERGRYWCENEQWGIIDKKGKEIVPCRFDEIFDIEGTDRFILCHEGGWEKGRQCVFDVEKGKVILEMESYFDGSYMFNECCFENGMIVFDEHEAGQEKDIISAYSVADEKWLVYREPYEGLELNGKTRIVVNKDGQDIVVF